MSKNLNFIKVADHILELLDYNDDYEIVLLLNIVKLANANWVAWGETKIITNLSALFDSIVEQEEPTRKLQGSIIKSLEKLRGKKIIDFSCEKLNWNSKLKIDCNSLLTNIQRAKVNESFTVQLGELRNLYKQPLKSRGNLIKAYFYMLPRINLANVEALIEHEGEFTLYDFEQNDDFNFTYVCDTLDYMRSRKNYRIECESWISKNHLSDTLGTLCEIGLLSCIQRRIANGSNGSLMTKRNFYYLPVIEEWKMNKVIDRYIARRNWTQVNDNTSENDSFDF